MRVLVTGSTGFIGSAVAARCATEAPFQVRGAHRQQSAVLPAGAESAIVGDLMADPDWSRPLQGVDAVVHTAARVHLIRDHAPDPLIEFRRVNVAGTLNLARQAAKAGVKRFVFLSSIKVNGEHTVSGRPFRPDDVPAPVDSYGVSKSEAEEGIRAIAKESEMEVVIIRPVLVYGPGVRANFLSMMRWLDSGIPLPLGAIHNARSLVALDNLVDLIVTCVKHPAAANRTFLVSDGEDLSTTALLRRTAAAMGKPARLVSVPSLLLEAASRALGKGDVARRLFSSLQVDISATRTLLGWSPAVGVDDALRQTAQHFLAGRTP